MPANTTPAPPKMEVGAPEEPTPELPLGEGEPLAQTLAVCSDVAAHCNRLDRRARAVFALAPVMTVVGGVAGGVLVRWGLHGAWLLVVTGTVSGALLATLLWNGGVTNLVARHASRTLVRASVGSLGSAAETGTPPHDWRWLRALVGDDALRRALARTPDGALPPAG